MANVSVVLAAFPARSIEAQVPLVRSKPIGTNYLTTGPASVQGDLVVPAANADVLVWIVKAVGGAMWVSFGPNPVAAAASGWLLLDGETLEVSAAQGDRIAAIDA